MSILPKIPRMDLITVEFPSISTGSTTLGLRKMAKLNGSVRGKITRTNSPTMPMSSGVSRRPRHF